MRKLIAAVALLVGIFFVSLRAPEVQEIADTLHRGKLVFLLIAAGIQAVWMINVGASYRAIYRALGLEERIEDLVLLSTAANFVNVIAPSAGVGGIAVFVTDARRKGYSGGRVTVAGVLYVLFEYAAILCVLALGLLVLVRRNNLTSAEIIASSLLVAVAVGMTALMILGARSEKALGRVLAWMARSVNRILQPLIHRPYLSESRAREFAHDAAAGLRKVRSQPYRLLTPALLALSSKALLVSVLFMTFLAFGVPYSVGTIIAGFSIGYLFLIVSPTPAGIGVVEGALTLALTSLSVSLGDAAIITLAYRGITFWLPLAMGILAFRLISNREKISPIVGAD